MKKIPFSCWGMLLVLTIAACQQSPPSPEYLDPAPISVESYPFQLFDFSATEPPDGWTKVASPTFKNGDIQADETGNVLLKKADATADWNTGLQHDDLDLDLRFMLGEKSSFSLLLQGRHELPIAGSNAPEKYAPSLRAPGLWQSLRLEFRLAGEAHPQDRVSRLWLNGTLMAENLEFPEATTPTGPLTVRIPAGSAAFRSMGTKIYQDQQISLQNLHYSYYPVETSNQVIDKVADQNVSELEARQTGSVDSMSRHLSPERANFLLDFNGEIPVQTAGAYGFYVQVGGGALLYIDDQLVVDADGERSFTDDKAYGQIELSEGTHRFRFTYLQNHRWWRRGMGVWLEGPGIARQALHAPGSIPEMKAQTALAVAVGDETELLRSFMIHKGKKRTHVLSVGSPTGISFAYDLNEGSILKAWNGNFLDVREMWVNRGEPQLAHPLGSVIDFVGKSGFLKPFSN
ncbi:MAG: PA14 domain-containing protein [Bacteroidota bacterium]